MYLVTHIVTFSESSRAYSKARFRRHSGGYVKKVQRGCRLLTARPKGATQFARCGVAVLGKVADIPGELRLAANELGGSECYNMSDEVH